MREIFFCIKTFVLTIAIVVVMQIQVGERTLENHALAWVQTSPLVTPLHSVAKGAAKLIGEWAEVAREKAEHYKRKIKGSFKIF